MLHSLQPKGSVLPKVPFFIAFLTLFLPKVSMAQIIQVPDDQPSIQAGIVAATDGDTVLVAPGTYFENINFLGKKIVVASQFVLDQDDEFITSTIINGGSPAHPDTASCVLFISGEDSTSVLEGFTLTGGTGTKWPDIHIGGKYREGGGILIELSSPTIKHNLIVDNEAIDKSAADVTSAGGGAIRCGDGNPLIINNMIMGNRGLYGAGIVLNFSGGTIKNNVIYQNSGGQDFGGSGIWCYSNGPADKIIENNTIVENTSTGGGAYGGTGGAMMVWSTTVTARNNILWGNTQSSGSQVKVISGTANITYSNVQGSWTGEGNLDVDPGFDQSNFYLLDSSPCVDSGHPDPAFNDPEDPNNAGFALWPAKGGLRNDMGAYGGSASSELPGSIIMTDVQSAEGQVAGYSLGQNYPNPFRTGTTFYYTIPQATFVQLKLYNSKGRQVKTLVDQFQLPGSYFVDFNGSTLPAGIYFYQLQTDAFAAVKRMVVVR